MHRWKNITSKYLKRSVSHGRKGGTAEFRNNLKKLVGLVEEKMAGSALAGGQVWREQSG